MHPMIFGIVLSIWLLACGKPTEETTPIRKDVTETVFASGTLEAEGLYKLTVQTSGYLTQLSFKEGDIVEKGKVLAIIENNENIINTRGASELLTLSKKNTAKEAPALLQAEYDIKTQKEKMELDKKTADRYKRLLESNSIAKIEYENAQLTYNTSRNNYQAALEYYNKLKRDANQQVVNDQTTVDIYRTSLGKNRVKTVLRGKVYEKYKEVGDYVMQGDILAEIGSPELLYAEVSVDETSISKIKMGQEAVIQLNTDMNRTYKGRVQEINPAFDEETQSFICKIYFLDSLDFRIVNTQLQTNIIVGEQKNALLIPRNYIDFGGYVQIKGKKEKTKVATQFVSNEWVQVLSGIDENTILVTDNILTP